MKPETARLLKEFEAGEAEFARRMREEAEAEEAL